MIHRTSSYPQPRHPSSPARQPTGARNCIDVACDCCLTVTSLSLAVLGAAVSATVCCLDICSEPADKRSTPLHKITRRDLIAEHRI
jgi:hypothetical protein